MVFFYRDKRFLVVKNDYVLCFYHLSMFLL